MKKSEIAEVGKHALALCGYEPFGDCRSIEIRLDYAKSQITELSRLANEVSDAHPDGVCSDVVKQWRQEVKVWKYALEKGKELLERQRKKLER